MLGMTGMRAMRRMPHLAKEYDEDELVLACCMAAGFSSVTERMQNYPKNFTNGLMRFDALRYAWLGSNPKLHQKNGVRNLIGAYAFFNSISGIRAFGKNVTVSGPVFMAKKKTYDMVPKRWGQ